MGSRSTTAKSRRKAKFALHAQSAKRSTSSMWSSMQTSRRWEAVISQACHRREDGPASEWWPYRNQFLLTVAAMKCLSLRTAELMIGALSTDGFHADGTADFIGRMNELFSLQEGDLEVTAPAIELTAVELVQKSQAPHSVLAWSHSCHVAPHACGNCRGCHKHFETMQACFSYAH